MLNWANNLFRNHCKNVAKQTQCTGLEKFDYKRLKLLLKIDYKVMKMLQLLQKQLLKID